MPILLNIHHNSPLWKGCQEAPAVVQKAVDMVWELLGSRVLDKLDYQSGLKGRPVIYEAGFVLADDDFVQSLNRDYRNRDRPTNVLSFPNTDTPTISGVLAEENSELGDVILAFETISKEAEVAGLPLADHLSHMAIHGVLHLLGYDHIRQKEAVEMENLERDILLGMGISDPYAENFVT